MSVKKEVVLANLRTNLRLLVDEKSAIESRLPQVTGSIRTTKTAIFLTTHEISLGDRIKITDGKKSHTGVILDVLGDTVTLKDKNGKAKKAILSKKDVKIVKID